MTESKARYTTLIMISVEAIIAFFYALIVIYDYRHAMAVQGDGTATMVIFAACVFIVIGVAVMLSVRYKVLFYVFLAIEVILVTAFFLPSIILIAGYSGPDPMTGLFILIYIAILAPAVYYLLSLRKINKAALQRGDPANYV